MALEGVILVKFWLHISDDEQLKRFEDRQSDPLRRWKITEEDWRNRKRNRDYDIAAEEMFERTDHHLAPWDLIAADQKRFARVRGARGAQRPRRAGHAPLGHAGAVDRRAQTASLTSGWRRLAAGRLTAAMRAAVLPAAMWSLPRNCSRQ